MARKKSKTTEDIEQPDKGGRPEEGLDTLPADWKRKVLELYAEGAADIEVRVMLRKERGTFSQHLWERWLKDEPEFSLTVKEGREASFAWWSKHLRKQSAEGKGNVTATIFSMKNRFPDEYKDRHEIGGHVVHTHEHTAVSELERRTRELAGLSATGADSTPVSH